MTAVTVAIAWWGWLLIWTGLGLALVAMLALFAWWLFRKSLRLLDDLSALAETTAILEVDDPVLPRQQLAVLAELRDIRSREDARRARRSNRRRQRHDRRMTRARRITSAEAARGPWPQEWR
ncbi:MAG: hypothetical protein JWP85_463 [Rhodoglobus sp.]|nr:hypothetical protein [Rhodoglobus sp.]